jgi:hypothetical protein
LKSGHDEDGPAGLCAESSEASAVDSGIQCPGERTINADMGSRISDRWVEFGGEWVSRSIVHTDLLAAGWSSGEAFVASGVFSGL